MEFTQQQGQDYAVDFAMQHKRARIVFPPGYGKSRVGCTFARKVSEKLGRRIRGLLITDSVQSRDVTWPDQIKIWNADTLHITGQLKVIRYADIHKHIADYDVIICDEADCFTETTATNFCKLRTNYLMFMTATEPTKYDKPRIHEFFNVQIPEQFRVEIPLDLAIDQKSLNDYIVRIFEYEISGQEWLDYLEICGRLDKAVRSKLKKWEESVRTERMWFIYNLKSKINIGHFLRGKLSNDRRILFSMSKASCEALSPNIYHSGTDDLALRAFEEEQIKELSTIKQVRRGSNFKRLKYAVALQINAQERDFIQMLGRMLRLEKDDTGEVWIICASNTVDADWTRKATKSLNKNKIIKEKLEYHEKQQNGI